MTVIDVDLKSLYTAHEHRVDFVDVPTLGYLVVGGHGAPDGPQFEAALATIYPVSYGAHFLIQKSYGEAPPVMPLEALWWMDGDTFDVSTPERWRWEAMIMQPEPIDALTIADAVERARAQGVEGLGLMRYEIWREGRVAQALHVGPYDEVAATRSLLTDAISAAGLQPRGRHHEIYLSDPRRCSPAQLHTIIRQPVEPATTEE